MPHPLHDILETGRRHAANNLGLAAYLGDVATAGQGSATRGGDPAYPLKLFLRMISVSLETRDIVNAQPALDA